VGGIGGGVGKCEKTEIEKVLDETEAVVLPGMWVWRMGISPPKKGKKRRE
jgi:hypothetical protein